MGRAEKRWIVLYLRTDYGRREEAGWRINYWRKCGTLWNIRHDIIWNKNITRLNNNQHHHPAQPAAWHSASSWMFGEKEDQIAELTKTQSRQGWNIMRVWSLRILDINYVMACKKLSLQASMLLEAVRPPQPNKPSTKCQCHPFILFRDFNSANVSIVSLHFALKILWMICVELFTENPNWHISYPHLKPPQKATQYWRLKYSVKLFPTFQNR